MKRDCRQRIVESALSSRVLTYGEKLFMVVAATLATQYVAGERRTGSRGMGADGRFALHLDYLAAALGTSEENAKKLRQGCTRKGHLSEVSRGTYGRPSTWHALVVRGEEKYGITFRQIFPPYGSQQTPSSGEKTSPLTYKTPVGGDHPPTSGVSPRPTDKVKAAKRELAELPARFPLTGCEWHEHFCPADCGKSPSSQEASA